MRNQHSIGTVPIAAFVLWVASSSAIPLISSCAVSSDSQEFNAQNAAQGGSGNTVGAGNTGGSNVDKDGSVSVPESDGSSTECVAPDPDIDYDGDGWTKNQGDCDDCNPTINPGAFDAPNNDIDDDCDGEIDNTVACDEMLEIADEDPFNGAKSIGLCRRSESTAGGKSTWGVISATYSRITGTGSVQHIQHGLLPNFGPADPREGTTMLALSSGTARAPDQPGHREFGGSGDMGTETTMPPGYPKASSRCNVEPSQWTAAFDSIAFEVSIRVPTNAHSFSFDFNFYTYEFPYYVCRQYNDAFVVFMDPIAVGLTEPNISFDSDGNAISVNNGLLEVCVPKCLGTNCYSCPLGHEMLEGTGFEGEFDISGNERKPYHAATGWLFTKSNVEPGSVITLKFGIWDAGDHVLDSLVLIDNFKWATVTAPGTHTDPVEIK